MGPRKLDRNDVQRYLAPQTVHRRAEELIAMLTLDNRNQVKAFDLVFDEGAVQK